jgi:hypothetical protein
MPNHHFISYSTIDAAEFALRLGDALAAGPPPLPVWLDKRKLRPGEDWDDQLVEAIKICESLIFIMTRDSVQSNSTCKQEWTRALKYKKPIIPLRLHADAELPFRLEPRQDIDFTNSFDARWRNCATICNGWLRRLARCRRSNIASPMRSAICSAKKTRCSKFAFKKIGRSWKSKLPSSSASSTIPKARPAALPPALPPDWNASASRKSPVSGTKRPPSSSIRRP